MNSIQVEAELKEREKAVRHLLAVEPNISQREVARRLGFPKSWTAYTISKLREDSPQERIERELELPHIPSGELDIRTLIDQRTARFVLKKRAKDARFSIPVKVKANGPIGITWFGDPHIDDDGCNWPQLQRDMNVVKQSEGMFAANIGDGHNNWQGRLARLYAYQSTSERDAWRLVEWFIKELPWLVFLDGNHGAWSGEGNPVKWMLENCNTLHDEVDVRLQLKFPNKAESTIYARHDFPGHSQWNTVHGIGKAATMGGFDDSLLVCGHKHTSGYSQVKNPKSGVISHLLRVAGYKSIDKYATDNFFKDSMISESAVTVFDPTRPTSHPHHVTVFQDVEEGAQYLKFLRSKK
jgi:hypothetical protein